MSALSEKMDRNYTFSYVLILDSARLRHILTRNEIDFDKVFEELKVVHSESILPDTNQSIENLEKQLSDQKERYDNAIKFRYIISKLTLTRRMTPTLKYFLSSIDNLVLAECNAYKYLLNYLELKKFLRDNFERNNGSNLYETSV